jgi:hypothetical protein
MLRAVYLFATLFAVLFRRSESFAMYMTNRYCHVPMTAGTEIMGQQVQESTNKTLRVFQNSVELENGTTINNLQELTVKLEPHIYQMVLECSNGVTFLGGKCDGRRTNTDGDTLIPDEEPGHAMVIRLVGAWARGYMEGVRVTPPFLLHYVTTNTQEL